MRTRRYSDETLNAFIDGELGPEETDELIAEMSQDAALSEEICRLNQTKELLRHVYRHPPQPEPRANKKRKAYPRVAAVLALLAVGGAGGWTAHQVAVSSEVHNVGNTQLIQLPGAANEALNVVLHVNSWEPERLASLLDETELLLSSYEQTGQRLNVEILTNGSGLDLLRADVTPYAARIHELQQRFDNLSFIACQTAMDRLKEERGVQAQLLPDSRVVPSAVSEIARRQREGWVYIQI